MTNKGVDISEACKILNEIIAPLKKERRVDILKMLPPGEMKTFGELQAETGISASSLHKHLNILVEQGYIQKTEERPARYVRDEYVQKLCELATYWKMKRLEELERKISEIQ